MSLISRKHKKKKVYLLPRLILLTLFAVAAVASVKTGVIPLPGYAPAAEGEPAAESSAALEAEEEKLRVHFIDVGQSDAALITCGSHAMLFDASDDSQEETVLNYLQSQGITRLDYVIGAHPDADHIGGMDEVIAEFDIGAVILPEYEQDTLCYRDVLMAMRLKGRQNTPPVVGNSYKLGDAEFTVIAPNREYETSNNWSVGIILKYRENRFLFTGDAEAEAEADILNNGIDISCDVYQAGHHGSYTSSSAAFLDAAGPEYAVISCGKDNLYGHPHKSALNRMRRRKIKVFRTDEQGTIIAESDGKNVTFNCAPSDTWTPGNHGETAEAKKDAA